MEPVDYYLVGKKYVFTAHYHKKRGECCGMRCKHCPYTKPHTKGNTTMAKRALYLDDVRTPTTPLPGYENWEVVRNYDEFTDWITKNGVPDFISFDHDLADEHMNDYFQQVSLHGFQYPAYETYQEKTGMDCARWLADYVQLNKVPLGKLCVHSHNPVGTTNIQTFLNGLLKHMGQEPDCFVMKHPFTTNQ